MKILDYLKEVRVLKHRNQTVTPGVYRVTKYPGDTVIIVPHKIINNQWLWLPHRFHDKQISYFRIGEGDEWEIP